MLCTTQLKGQIKIMSMQNWSTTVYGVRENDINNIPMDAAWDIFKRLQTAKDSNLLKAKMEQACCDNNVKSADEMSDEMKDDFVRMMYEETSNTYTCGAKTAVLAELVAKCLGIDMDDIIIESNDDGQIILGIGLYYPWEQPEILKNATQGDYENAFINAFAILGIDGNYCDIDSQSMENWG